MKSITIKSSSIKRSRKLPDFIKEAPIFNTIDEFKKIFSEIGLKNNKEKIIINFLNKETLQLIKTKLLNIIIYNNDKWSSSYKNIIILNKICSNILDVKINKTSIFFQKDIIADDYHKNILIKKNTNIILLLNKIIKDIIKNTESIKNFKNDIIDLLITTNLLLKKNKLQIVFSSEGTDGLNDLSTISMRGIRSCQGWKKSHKKCLVGTITDPCAGVIYITNGEKTTYGSRMLARAIVRYAVDKHTKKPIVVLEKVYISGLKQSKYDKSNTVYYREIFLNYLKNNVAKTISVISSEDNDTDTSLYAIPMSKPLNWIVSTPNAAETYMSYIDSDLDYSYSKNCSIK